MLMGCSSQHCSKKSFWSCKNTGSRRDWKIKEMMKSVVLSRAIWELLIYVNLFSHGQDGLALFWYGKILIEQQRHQEALPWWGHEVQPKNPATWHCQDLSVISQHSRISPFPGSPAIAISLWDLFAAPGCRLPQGVHWLPWAHTDGCTCYPGGLGDWAGWVGQLSFLGEGGPLSLWVVYGWWLRER